MQAFLSKNVSLLFYNKAGRRSGQGRSYYGRYFNKPAIKNFHLNEIYVDNVEAAKKDLGVLEITPKTASYLDHRTHPIFMRKFEF